MASKEVMGKINKLIDEAFFVKDNREQDSVIKDIDFFKSRISHSRLINEIDKDINVLYATGKFDDLSNIRNILYLNLNKWILSYNTASSIMKGEHKKMLDIKSHAIKTVLDIINSLLDLERYPVTLSNTSIKRLKEQHEDNKKEIINSIPNLFQFIEYLHSNINHFNDWAKWIPIFTGEQTKIDESDEEFYKSKVENHSSKLTIDRIRILTRIWLIIPFRKKVKNLEIADLDKKEYNFIHNKYNQAATALIYKVKEDKSYIREIHKIYGLYFGFKRKIDPRFIKLYPLLFVTLDNVIKSIRSIRYFQADRLTPEVEFVEFERKDDKLKNSISEEFQPMSIETKSDDANVVVVETPNDNSTKITPHIKTLFSFIDFLHANIENFNQYDNVILELNKMFERFFQLGFHFEETIEKRALQEKIDVKWDIISDNIVTPIKDKVAELNLFDWSAPETLSNNYFRIANKIGKEFEKKDLDAILKAKNQYIEFANEISSNVISNVTKEAQSMFEFMNKMMFEIAKNFWKKGDKPFKKIEAKQVDDIQKEIESYKSGEIVSLPLDITSSNTESTQFNIDAPYSNTENYIQLIEQTNQDKREEDAKSHASHASHVPERTSDNVDEDLETKEKSKQYTIDTTTLNKYFHPVFKGKGNNSHNYFDQLLEDIKSLNNGKEVGQVALMLYESKHINSLKPNEFAPWYRIFCECIGQETMSYKKSHLRHPKERIKNIFNYIEPKHL